MNNEMDRREFIGIGAAAVGVFASNLSAESQEQGMKVAVLTQTGGAHLSLYFQSLKNIPEVASVVLAAPDEANAAEARQILGDKLAAVYRSHEELLKKERPPFALVSMEAKWAHGTIRLALEHDCHVLAEKPACLRADDFEYVVKLAEQKNLHLMLALANRLNPEILEAKRLIEADDIGKIYGIEMHLIQDQTRLRSPDYQKSWFADRKRAGGGHLTWLGIHWLDLAMYLTGSDIIDSAGFTTNIGGENINIEDSAAVALRFSNGVLGTLTSAYYLDKGYQSRLRIWGSKGWISIDAGDKPTLRVYRNGISKSAEGDVIADRGNHDAYTVFVRAGILASLGKAPPPITGPECLRVLRVLYNIYHNEKK